MSENSFEEENLDEFMIKASDILIEKEKPNPEKNSIIESLKQHLLSIYENKEEMDNFFKTINSVIFSGDLKLIHKEKPYSDINYYFKAERQNEKLKTLLLKIPTNGNKEGSITIENILNLPKFN